MYEHGNGVPRDLLRAYAWYGVASAGGDEMALELRAHVEKALTPDELTRARDMARELHQRYPTPGQNAE
jgi:TPR repeat protein